MVQPLKVKAFCSPSSWKGDSWLIITWYIIRFTSESWLVKEFHNPSEYIMALWDCFLSPVRRISWSVIPLSGFSSVLCPSTFWPVLVTVARSGHSLPWGIACSCILHVYVQTGTDRWIRGPGRCQGAEENNNSCYWSKLGRWKVLLESLDVCFVLPCGRWRASNEFGIKIKKRVTSLPVDMWLLSMVKFQYCYADVKLFEPMLLQCRKCGSIFFPLHSHSPCSANAFYFWWDQTLPGTGHSDLQHTIT